MKKNLSVNNLEHGGKVLASSGGFDIVDCNYCGFSHVFPIPSEDELEVAYSHEYYDQEKPLYIERYAEDLEWWNEVYSTRYKIFENFLPSTARSVLDIGSGPGYFLLQGKLRGWRVKGIEPSIKAAKYSSEELGLDIENTFFDEASASRLPKFDAVNISLVLEHIPNPSKFLELIFKQLSPSGMLCIVVPNDFNPIQKILKNHLNFPEWWVAPPHHLNYFNHGSLAALVERCGFEVCHIESTFPIDMFLLMGENYVGSDQCGRKVHSMRKAFENSLAIADASELRAGLYKAFANLGVGREVVLFAQKRSS